MILCDLDTYFYQLGCYRNSYFLVIFIYILRRLETLITITLWITRFYPNYEREHFDHSVVLKLAKKCSCKYLFSDYFEEYL